MPGAPTTECIILRTGRVLAAIQGEPPLAELLAEPIIRLRAAKAGVTTDQLRALCRCTGERLRAMSYPK